MTLTELPIVWQPELKCWLVKFPDGTTAHSHNTANADAITQHWVARGYFRTYRGRPFEETLREMGSEKAADERCGNPCVMRSLTCIV